MKIRVGFSWKLLKAPLTAIEALNSKGEFYEIVIFSEWVLLLIISQFWESLEKIGVGFSFNFWLKLEEENINKLYIFCMSVYKQHSNARYISCVCLFEFCKINYIQVVCRLYILIGFCTTKIVGHTILKYFDRILYIFYKKTLATFYK